mmetsp:Transcript_47414/g.122658  ORF Transcript_47414/g.122658 Transcript_47414/m.122658 type:complete len:146 (-) Transcript_47414:338-775(-)|eukprot:CAMPEP_0113879370 /NCGR_PEP_ID=MMETSP0780_2-20120614/7203_1 /TAXON_ID=652834 /ORGANISM="Palpitomonas bilix" /LENGTH=145 /DNA_ID=CAMNT_0000865949 /DNA_START=247 /DNA_END=684 /DNA_ORIENTATION=+ /assembly_acc=CAM_ASM_000599
MSEQGSEGQRQENAGGAPRIEYESTDFNYSGINPVQADRIWTDRLKKEEHFMEQAEGGKVHKMRQSNICFGFEGREFDTHNSKYGADGKVNVVPKSQVPSVTGRFSRPLNYNVLTGDKSSDNSRTWEEDKRYALKNSQPLPVGYR